jgi:alkanesulfonate monooxygenase SsuD/methylene tetrahydromethanopterin reductase-like flavin-dependent oxidoreductase (luciferase family)
MMAMTGNPDQIAAQLIPYVNLGFDMFILMGRYPLDHESQRLFIQEVAPRLRDAANRAA